MEGCTLQGVQQQREQLLLASATFLMAGSLPAIQQAAISTGVCMLALLQACQPSCTHMTSPKALCMRGLWWTCWGL
jgi:hypothetical protein